MASPPFVEANVIPSEVACQAVALRDCWRNPWHCRKLHHAILRLRCAPLRMTERLYPCHDLRVTRALTLPTLAGIANRRQAFAKLRLLTFGLSLLLRLACLLLGTRT